MAAAAQVLQLYLQRLPRDPLLREVATSVVSVRIQHPSEDKAASNRKKKNDATSAEPLLQAVLHDTVLFPEGGGQPSDVGQLITADGIAWDVVEVKRHGGHAVHYVRVRDGIVPAGLEVGARLTASLGEIGYQRRLDHMCMHTSQHVLSALLEAHLGLPTLSWALTIYPTPSYVELPRALTLEEIARIQAEAHRVAYEGRSMHVEVEPLRSEGADANHPEVETHKSGRTIGKALPRDYTGGVKRVVVIDGIDRNPCCGTHLPSLHNLQPFLLPQSEMLTRKNTSTARLFFLCGPRLHALLSTTHNLLTETAGIMSCGPPLVPQRVAQVVEERKRAEKRAEALASELARLIAGDIAQQIEKHKLEAGTAKVFTKHFHRIDDPASALAFLQALASSIGQAASEEQPYVLVLSSSPSQSVNSITTLLLAGSADGLVKIVGDGLRSRLNVKGGGKGVRWSGKWSGAWKDSREGKIIGEILADVSDT